MSFQSVGHRTKGLTSQSFGWLAKKHGLTESEVRDTDVRYKLADLDRSGQLDRKELKQLLRETIAGTMSNDQLERYLKAQWHNVDRDASGTVDFDEFLSLYAVLKKEGRLRKPEAPAAGVGKAGTDGKAPAAGAGADASKTGATAGSAGKAVAAAAKTGARRNNKTGSANLGVTKKQKRKDRKSAFKKSGKSSKKQRIFRPTEALTQQNYVTNEVVWSALRKNHSFLVRRDRVTFSAEKGNVRNLHTRFSSGLVSNRSLDISGTEKGINMKVNAVSLRRRTQPARSHYNVALSAAKNRGLAAQVKKQLKSYRSGLTSAALARITRVKQTLSRGVTKKTQRTRGRRNAANASANANATSEKPAQ